MDISFLSLVTYGITTILSLMYKDSFFGNASIGKKILRRLSEKVNATKQLRLQFPNRKI